MKNIKVNIKNGSVQQLLNLLYDRAADISELIVYYRFKEQNNYVTHDNACVAVVCDSIDAAKKLNEDGFLMLHRKLENITDETR